jgi:hypothetical protein
MMAATSNGSTKARGRGVAAAPAMAAAMLLPGGGLDTVAHAQSPFEAPPVLRASEEQTRALIKNPWYSLSVLTSLVTALDRLSGVNGRPAVVALALTATSEDQARFLASAVEMLAAHHQTVEPLAEVVARGTVIGRTQRGAQLVPGAVDYVA